jgi:hypothetical protein
MKWIGQHIWDFISRFRSTVYIENLETSSEENVLVVDSDGKVTKNTTLGGSDVTMTNGVDNRVMTATGAAAITGESGFTYDASTELMTLSSSTSASPSLYIQNTNTDATSGKFIFSKAATGADDDEIGIIGFNSQDDGGGVTSFAQIVGEIADASNNDEGGRVKIEVLTNSSEMQEAFTATGLGTGSRVDIGLGYGTDSTTTIAGDLDIDGDNMTAAGALTLTPGGLFKTVATGVEIENGSSTGAPALLIDNDDADQIALSISAVNTTANVIGVEATKLTTGYGLGVSLENITDSGGGIYIDWNDDQTTDMNRVGGGSAMLHLDYDKSGDVASLNAVAAQGILLNMDNNATNDSGNTLMYGMNFNLTHANSLGTMDSYGINGVVTGGDNNIGLQLQCSNGKGYDIKLLSSADVADYFTIRTITDGETTLETTEGGVGSTAHMNLVADGDINLDAAGDIELNADGGNIVFKDDTVTHAELLFSDFAFNIYGGPGDEGRLQLYEDSDSGTNYISFRPPQSIASNKVIHLPDTAGIVQIQGANTGQIVNTKLNRDDTYVLYLNTRTYWYSVSGTLGYTGNVNVSAGNWSSWSDDRQARHSGYIATSACKVNKVRFVGLFSTSYTSGALDFEFAIQKWTPGNNTTSTVTTTYMTHTDHDGSYTEGSIYNLEFTVSGNNTLAAGDAFTLFARCVDSDTAARLQYWYGNCNAEIELT